MSFRWFFCHQNGGKCMKRVTIKNIRNIKDLVFDIPEPGLHILTGTNGSGKTTLFTCISRICSGTAFRVGFPSSENAGMDVFSGSIIYTTDTGTVSYSKRDNQRWRPSPKKSTVLHDFGYSAIKNITTKNERLFSQEYIQPKSNLKRDEWLNNNLNIIFDTNRFTKMAPISISRPKGRRSKITRRDVVYAISNGNGKYYTEQNFSFGEIVLLNLLYDIKNTPNNALILIDELELALHPSAQIRLIDVLRNIAVEKHLTIIVSTHSASIIRAQESVIFLDVMQDKKINVIPQCPPAKAIGAIGMRDDSNSDIIVLVEDEMAKMLFSALQKKYCVSHQEATYLDIKVLNIGEYHDVIKFQVQMSKYIFYKSVYMLYHF